MDMDRRIEVEALKRDLHALEREEAELKEKMDIIQLRKSELYKQIEKYSDEQYEKDLLAQLYEQKRKK